MYGRVYMTGKDIFGVTVFSVVRFFEFYKTDCQYIKIKLIVC